MKRLLVLACSERKVPTKGVLPAIDRYNGPTFKVLRKYLRENEDDDLVVYILSAKFGLIASSRRIPDYNLRLSRELSRRLQPAVCKTAKAALADGGWESVGICAGKDYKILLAAVTDTLLDERLIEHIKGGQGSRLSALKNWLLKTG